MAKKTKKAAMTDARIKFYDLLALLYEKEPNADLLNALSKIDYDVACENADMRDGYDGLKAFFANRIENETDELAADYAKVFLAAGEAEGNAAFPYESVYTGKERLLMQEAWEKVKDFYAKKGIGIESDDEGMKEDHIASELACMAYLAKNGTPDESLKFLDGHLLNWVEPFAGDVAKNARHGFYPAVAKLTKGFLEADKQYLESLASDAAQEPASSYKLSKDGADELFKKLQKHYRIYAPALQKERTGGKETVRYREIGSVDDIYNSRTSDFPAKEAYYPVMQTMFFFKDKDVYESQIDDDKDILLLMHPCDINAMDRLDNIFIKNGAGPDMYYSRLRDKVKVVLLECEGSSPNCFCVSMDSNKTDNYEMAMRVKDGEVYIQIKDPAWEHYMQGAEASDFAPVFVTENERSAEMPHIPDDEALKLAAGLKYWEKFNDKCISCGGCNIVCPTCGCYDVNDIIYDETSLDGERRRVWSSCMLDTFTQTAGGARARETAGANMRFKALHKVHDYKTRFGEDAHMCVGCGRCIIRCPKELDFSATLNEFADELKKAKGGN